MRKKRWLLLIILVAVLVGVITMFIDRMRTHGFSAREKPMAFEAWLAKHVRDLATPSAVKNLKNPIGATPLVIAAARDHFADHCASCHGNRGDGKTMYGEGLYPPPPDLREPSTQDLTDGELFNIIKNGIRFTGMPGFGGDDDDSWKLVAFIRHLPKLSEKELELMQEINQQFVSGANNDQH